MFWWSNHCWGRPYPKLWRKYKKKPIQDFIDFAMKTHATNFWNLFLFCASRYWQGVLPEACKFQYPTEHWKCYFGSNLHNTLSSQCTRWNFQNISSIKFNLCTYSNKKCMHLPIRIKYNSIQWNFLYSNFFNLNSIQWEHVMSEPLSTLISTQESQVSNLSK